MNDNDPCALYNVCFQSEDNLMSKLNSLSAAETRVLLSRYFDKVISLRELERKKDLMNSELEV